MFKVVLALVGVVVLTITLYQPRISASVYKSENASCGMIQGYACSASMWVLGSNVTEEINVADGDALELIIVPGLAGGKTISILSCSNSFRVPHYVYNDGCAVYLRPEETSMSFKASASFNKYDDWFYVGFFALEAYDFPGHFVVQQSGYLRMGPLDYRTSFRTDASWMYVNSNETDLRNEEVAHNEKVHVINSLFQQGTSLPNVFDDEDDSKCSREHHGCCSASDKSFTAPSTPEFGLAPHNVSVAVLVVSSGRTLKKRFELIRLWLFKYLRRNSGPWTRAIMSLDCFSDFIDPTLPLTDWLIGPIGYYPSGMPRIAVRVCVALHWVFHRFETDFYFTVDDDTIVFSNHFSWALSYLPNPRTQFWYVGSSSEWRIKTYYHGLMAFGGGGVLVSRKAAEVWLNHFPGTAEDAGRKYFSEGKCSHSGGDGAFCRCLRLAAGEDSIFTDFFGFHQFDIVGTPAIALGVYDTCPNCPSQYEQTGIWFNNIIGSRPMLTFHHLLALETGSLYPGMNGSTSAIMLMEAYEHHPALLLGRRTCGRTELNAFTMCINFGHRLQIYRPSVSPIDALNLLDTLDGVGTKNPKTRITAMSVKQFVVDSQLCSLTYKDSPSKNRFNYVGTRVEPRPAHDGGCHAIASVRISPGARWLEVNLQFDDLNTTATWERDLSELLPKENRSKKKKRET